MNRRDFLKGCAGVGAIAVVPALAKEQTKPGKYSLYSEGKLTTSDNPDFGLAQLKPEGGQIVYNGQGSEARLLQEGMNTLADIEYV